jgi:hypothetical protein
MTAHPLLRYRWHPWVDQEVWVHQAGAASGRANRSFVVA